MRPLARATSEMRCPISPFEAHHLALQGQHTRGRDQLLLVKTQEVVVLALDDLRLLALVVELRLQAPDLLFQLQGALVQLVLVALARCDLREEEAFLSFEDFGHGGVAAFGQQFAGEGDLLLLRDDGEKTHRLCQNLP